MDIAFRQAGIEDIPLLAQMNRALIRDEGSENPMDTAQLAARMEDFFTEGYTALWLLRDADIIGYCLYRTEFPESGTSCVYVRQFYILPAFRRQGLGKRAFTMLKDTVFASTEEIALDVLHNNAAGRAFWENVGFAPHWHRLRLKRDM